MLPTFAMYGRSSYPGSDEKTPSGHKWRAAAAAAAACLGLALLIAVLVLLLTYPRLPSAAAPVAEVGSLTRSRTASVDISETEAGSENLGSGDFNAIPEGGEVPVRKTPPRLLIKVATRPGVAVTEQPVAAPVTTFSASFMPPEWLYGSTSSPPRATANPSPGQKTQTSLLKALTKSKGPSPVSLALLVTELLLVHDVQRLMRQNDTALVRALISDEEALALSSLFLSPGRVRELMKAREKGPTAELKARKRYGGWVGDARELVVDALRLGGNLWKAYVSDASSDGGRTALQCIWTLYCRNLEKMGALKGPYGLAGRMNGLGLRLAMKDATAEDVFNFIAREMHAVAMEKAFGGEFEGHMMVLERVLEVGLGMRFRNARDNSPVPSVNIDCPRLFPRCTPLEAPGVVMKMVLGDEL